jgi:perosamine synthetase
MKKIAHSNSFITQSDIRSACNVLRRNYVGHGAAVKRLETSFERYFGKSYGIATNSGSSALRLSLLALNLKKGVTIITSVHVCTAVVNVILNLGYKPYFVDVAKNDINMDIIKTETFVDEDVGAILIPYVGGYAVDISKLMNLNVPIIEDCASSLGATINRKPVGSFGLFSIFSFASTKLITGGSGGMIITDSPDHQSKIRRLMAYNDPDHLMIETAAFNHNMNDLEAALINNQFSRMNKILKMRKAIADRYTGLLRTKQRVTLIEEGKGIVPSYYRYVFLASNRDNVLRLLNKNGIDARSSIAHFMYKYLPALRGKYEYAKRIEAELISLPLYPNLKKDDQQRVLHVLDTVL